MSNPILSICIPTKNRANYLTDTLNSIISDEYFIATNDIEIIISDNCSDDDTEKVCRDFAGRFPDKIRYIRQEKDLHDKNFIEVLKLANGKFAKLNNDTLSYNKNSLKEIVSTLLECNASVAFFSNKDTNKSQPATILFKNADEFFVNTTYKPTWIGGLCVKTEDYLKLSEPDRFSHLNFAQIDIIARLSLINGVLLINKAFMTSAVINKKGGYNIAQIFGENLITILSELLKDKTITQKTYQKILKTLLIQHINPFYFDHHNKYTFVKDGYFKYLFKYYKYKPYFYLNFMLSLLKYAVAFITHNRKN